jgi:hypothetical protein
VAERFRTIAARREAGAHGYGDHNSDWRATPEALRKAVDAYNRANSTQDLYIGSSASPRWRAPWTSSSATASWSCNAVWG